MTTKKEYIHYSSRDIS